MNVLVINGPNLNMLGVREPLLYGAKTYEDLVNLIESTCIKHNITAEVFQSNHEGVLIDKIQSAFSSEYDAIIINGSSYAHTSIAILDALKAVGKPVVEVHITDHAEREAYRRHSYISEYAVKTISGWGISGYVYAIMFINTYIEKSRSELLPSPQA